MSNSITVAQYLKIRLEEIGLEQMFGVAGNYTAGFLDTVLADKNSPIKISGNANELCAGYTADAYARLKGISALYVTYSVGAFSLLNTIAGSYVEQVPVVLINGAPTNKEDAIGKNAGLLYSHTTGYQMVDIHMFRPITAAAERITNARQASYQIDAVLTALLTEKRPVYLEVTEDVWRASCTAPRGKLQSGVDDIITVSEAKAAAQATIRLMMSKSKSIFWAGVELQRHGLQNDFLDLLETINAKHVLPNEYINFVTSAMSKSVISENHPRFKGCVTLSKAKVNSLIGDEGVLVSIGAWTTSKDTHSQDIRSSNTIIAANNGVFVGAEYYPSVQLKDYITQLKEAFQNLASNKTESALTSLMIPKSLLSPIKSSQKLGYDAFFDSLNKWITQDDILVVDAGFPLIGSQGIHISSQNGFVAQAAWLSIGYSVAAGTGIKCACPDKRAIVVVGDGAFHETCQAISDQHAYGQNTVVFVLANGIYGIEQYLVNPNPFRKPPIDYLEPLEETVYAYNELPKWQISKLADVFGGEGRKADSIEALNTILAEIRSNTESNFIVEVTIPTVNVPAAIAKAADNKVGEDEISHPKWPPKEVF